MVLIAPFATLQITTGAKITLSDSLGQRKHVRWLLHLAAQYTGPAEASTLQKTYSQKHNKKNIRILQNFFWCKAENKRQQCLNIHIPVVVHLPPGNMMRASCSIRSALRLRLSLSSGSRSSCWLRWKWQSAVENAKFGSWDRFLCSWNTKQIGFLYQTVKLTLVIPPKPPDFPERLQSSPNLCKHYTLLQTYSFLVIITCFWHSKACCALFCCPSSSSLSEMDKWRGERISWQISDTLERRIPISYIKF